MIRESRLRFPALFLAVVLVAACGDDGTDPGTGDFDAVGISEGVDASIAPVEASNDAGFILSDFIFEVLGGGFQMSRMEATDRIRNTHIRALARQVGLSTELEIPAEFQGQTFVYNPDELAWQPDETRTGAPADGLRVIWYGTDEAGSILLPLQELGYIDLTDEDDSTLERLGVVIVRNDGSVTLADYTHGYSIAETETTYSEEIELVGTFSDGTASVDIDISLVAEGEFEGDESYAWNLFFEGAEASYRWALEGGYDLATDNYQDDLVVTINKDGLATVLDMELAGNEAQSGGGTLTHAGTLIANVNVEGDAYTFTRPGGGSFTQAEEEGLYNLMVTMVIYGPLLLLSMPLLFVTL